MYTMNNTEKSRIDKKQNNSILFVLLIPIVSCIISSIIGIVIGQVGNLVYLGAGDAGNWLAIPGFCFLFLMTMGISFLITWLSKKLLAKKARKTEGSHV